MSDMADVLTRHQLFDSWWSAETGAEVKCMCAEVQSYDDTAETDHEAHARHQAAALSAAGFGPVQETPRVESCPTRLMDGRNEIRCWLTAGHEGDCK